MSKTELGVKRRCLSCSTLFFDFNRVPIVCPKCAVVFHVVEIAHALPRRTAMRSVAAERPLTEQSPEAELVLREVEDAGGESDILPIEEDDEIKIEEIVEIEPDDEAPGR